MTSFFVVHYITFGLEFSMENIKVILDNLFRKRKLESRLKGFQVFEVWEDAVGARIARHSQPKGFRNHILWVSVDNSIWMQQLKFLEGQIKEKLNQMLGSPLVEKIRFQIGEITSSPKEISVAANFPEWSETYLDDQVQKNIEQEVAFVKDEEIKKRLKALLQKSAQFLHYKGKE